MVKIKGVFKKERFTTFVTVGLIAIAGIISFGSYFQVTNTSATPGVTSPTNGSNLTTQTITGTATHPNAYIRLYLDTDYTTNPLGYLANPLGSQFEYSTKSDGVTGNWSYTLNASQMICGAHSLVAVEMEEQAMYGKGNIGIAELNTDGLSYTGTKTNITAPTHSHQDVGTDPSGRYGYAIDLDSNDLRVIDLVNNSLITTVNPGAIATDGFLYSSFSSDGNVIYLISNNEIISYDISNPTNPISPTYVQAFVDWANVPIDMIPEAWISGDGTYFVGISPHYQNNNTMYHYQVSPTLPHTLTYSFTESNARLDDVVYDKYSHFVYVGLKRGSLTDEGRIRTLDMTNPNSAIVSTWISYPIQSYVWGMAISPDGTRLVAGIQRSGTRELGLYGIDSTTGVLTQLDIISVQSNTNAGVTTAGFPLTPTASDGSQVQTVNYSVPCDLTVNKVASPNLRVGSTGTYAITVTNAASSSGYFDSGAAITVTDSIPNSLALTLPITSTGWSCNVVPNGPTNDLTCTYTGGSSLSPGASLPAINFGYTVTRSAAPTLSNTASVSSVDEIVANTANNSDTETSQIQYVSVGNKVFADTNYNGLLDGAEQGIAGVAVEVWLDNGDNSFNTASDNLIDTVTTNGSGDYRVDYLANGNYFIRIPNSVFGAGQPLYGYLSSSGSKALTGIYEPASLMDNTDNNDDGTKTANGVISSLINLSYGAETANQGGWTANYNQTIDFGMILDIDLSLDKQVSSADNPIVVGSQITYQIVVTNNSTNVATNISVADTLPAGVTLLGSSATSGSYSAGTWSIPTISANSTATLTIQATVNQDGQIDNTASITTFDQLDSNSTNDNDTASITVDLITPDLVVEKTSIGSFVENSLGNYRIQVSNKASTPSEPVGQVLATSPIVVTDSLDSGLSFDSWVSSTNWNCLVTGQDIECTYQNYPVLESQVLEPIEFRVLIDESAAPEVANQVLVETENELGSTYSDNVDLINTPVAVLSTDLKLDKTISPTTPGPYSQNSQIAYQIKVDNIGTNQATQIQVRDTIPTGTSFVSANTGGNGSYNQTTGIWDISSIPAGGSATLNLIVRVDIGSGVIVNISDIISMHQTDTNLGNNYDSTYTVLNNASEVTDLSISKTFDTLNSGFNTGNQLVYKLEISNLGPIDATAVSVEDILPAGLSLVGTQGQGNYNGSVWSVGNLALNQTKSILITTTINATSGSQINNLAQINSFDQVDTNGANNSDSIEFVVGVAPIVTDLGLFTNIDFASSTSDFSTGGTVVYIVNLENYGDQDASNIIVNDLLPAGLSFVSATPSNGTYNQSTGEWSINSLPAYGSEQLRIVATINASLGQAVDNYGEIVSVASNLVDPNPANDNDTIQFTVGTTPVLSDIAIVKNIDYQNSDSEFATNQTVSYEIIATNQTNQAATNVVIVDNLPAGLSFVSANPTTGSYNATTGQWQFASLPAQGQAKLEIIATIQAGLNTQISNLAALESLDQIDIDYSNDSDGASFTVGVEPMLTDIAVYKTIDFDNSGFNQGDSLTYQIIVDNLGDMVATGLRVNDDLPDGTSLVNANPSSGNYDPITGIWQIPSIGVGATATLDLEVNIDAVNGQEVINSASLIDFDQDDNNYLNDNDLIAFTVGVVPVVTDLEVTKTIDDQDSRTDLQEGGQVVYQIIVRNIGANNATNIMLSDSLPVGLEISSVQASLGTFDQTNLSWSIPSLAVNAQASLELVADISAYAGQFLTNYGYLEDLEQIDTGFRNNQDHDSFQVLAAVDTDGDGVPDVVEEDQGTDPNDPNDYLDTDGDGVPDYVEEQDGTDPNDPNDYTDTDQDGVPDYVEEQDGTDPNDQDDYLDTDGDGVPDYVEEQDGTDPNDLTDYLDTDGDGVPDYVEEQDGTDPNDPNDFVDENNNGIPDYLEGIDTDGDGVPDVVEEEQGTDPNDPDDYLDTDGDGVPDYVEEQDGTDPNDSTDYTDTDGDGVPDYVEEQDGTDPNDQDDYLDTDGDGVPDYVEEQDGTDPNDLTDYLDTDGDGVPDYVEEQDGTDPNDPNDFVDENNNGVPDYIENIDTDGDGVPDVVEEEQGTDPNDPDDYLDTDGDGVPDYVEEQDGTDPNDPNDFVDENNNGIPDYLEEIDTDGDGVPDYVEEQDGTDPNDPDDYLDTDGDGVSDYQEEIDGTDPNDPNDYTDTDGDGVPDVIEEQDGTDPNDSNDYTDTDDDGVPDYIEEQDGTDPNDPNDYNDTDEDGVPDYIEEQEGTDPNDPNDYLDTDGDGVPDYVEEQNGTDPDDPKSFLDKDGNGIPDYLDAKDSLIDKVKQLPKTGAGIVTITLAATAIAGLVWLINIKSRVKDSFRR